MATLEQSEMDQAGAKVTPNLFCVLREKYRLVRKLFLRLYTLDTENLGFLILIDISKQIEMKLKD